MGPLTTERLKRWADVLCLRPFAVLPLMRAARTSTLTPQMAADAIFHPPLEDYKRQDALIQEFVRKRRHKGMKNNAEALLLFLLYRCHRGMSIAATFLAVLYIGFRIVNNIVFTELIATLAGSREDLLFPNTSALGTTAGFCLAATFSSVLQYMLDQISKHLGNRIRIQMVYSVHSATLRSKQSTINEFKDNELVLMAGIDSLCAMYAVWFFFYLFALPIEFFVLFYLSCAEVGVRAAFFSFIPFVLVFAAKAVLMSISAKHQAKAREISSRRYSLVNEGIASNMVVKLMNVGREMLDKIFDMRKEEHRNMRWYMVSNAVSVSAQLYLPPVMSWLAMVLNVALGKTVTANALMTVLSYYRTMVAFDTFRIVTAIQSMIDSHVSCNRVFRFLDAATPDVDDEEKKGQETNITGNGMDKYDDLISLAQASFSWSAGAEISTLSNITATLPRGKLIGVAGSIGSGKSSFLSALMGEMKLDAGLVVKHDDWMGTVAYAPQKPWLQSGTLRRNICFSEPSQGASLEWLQLVIEACGLQVDVEGFDLGLDHDIGEAGSNLSGGQKARVSLARAVYSQSSISILDDPLCALDPSLASQVFHHVLAPGGLLRGKNQSTLLVTSNTLFLSQCDVIIVIKDGTVSETNSFESLKSQLVSLEANDHVPKAVADETARPAAARKLQDQLLHQESALRTKKHDSYIDVCLCVNGLIETDFEEPESDALAAKESDNSDTVDKNKAEKPNIFEDIIKGVDIKPRPPWTSAVSFLGFWGMLGGLCLVLATACVFLWQYVTNRYLDDNENHFNAFHTHISIGLSFLLSIFGALILYLSFLRGSTRLQCKAIAAVFMSPYLFFSHNPASRVAANLSQDSLAVERGLSNSMAGMWVITAQLVGTVIISCVSLWELIALFIPLTFCFYFIQRMYASAAVPISQVDAGTRAPVTAAITDALQGLQVTHALHGQDKLEQFLELALRDSRGTSSAVIDSAGWLSFTANVLIYDTIAVVIAITISIIFIPGPDSLGPIVLSNVMSLSSVIGIAAVLISNVESSLTALQRLLMFSELPPEVDEVRRFDSFIPEDTFSSLSGSNSLTLEDSTGLGLSGLPSLPAPPTTAVHSVTLHVAWPSEGNIEFYNVCASYSWKLSPVLRNVSVSIPSGSSCAFVGRSGSGKSTAFLSLTGMIPITSGSISIDDVSTTSIDLQTLRNALAVVPQDPILFSGSIRANLDPVGSLGDAAIWEALRAVGLLSVVEEMGGLQADPVESRMSQGRRQLLCLARALIRDCTVLLLDEASASVDVDTEHAMNATVGRFARGEFSVIGSPRPRTVVEVAHRLSGVLKMDQVVVLKKGRVVEQGPPVRLAAKDGVFAGMVRAQGLTC